VSENAVRGPKRVFVLTDGYSSQAGALVEALHRSDAREGVQVVGVAVGVERSHTRAVYKDWIHAAIPSALPAAFRELFAQAPGTPSAAAEAVVDADRLVVHAGGEEGGRTVEDILKHRQAVFASIDHDLSHERAATLVSGNGAGVISLDLAVVLDVTGSMAPCLKALKRQIRAIADGIPKAVKDKFPGVRLLLRLACVPYRDVGEAVPAPLDFTAMPTEGLDEARLTAQQAAITEKLDAYVGRLQAEGGGDESENVFGALSVAAGLRWSSKVRYCVLITDAPAHGARFHAPGVTDLHLGGHADIPDPDATVRSLVASQVELVCCHVDRAATQQMAQELQRMVAAAGQAVPAGAGVPDKPMLNVDLYDPSRPASRGALHLVFVLDESGSMEGSWGSLVQAYTRFLALRKNANQGRSNDIVTVVQFDSSARVTVQQVPVSLAPTTLIMRGGGTAFGPALQMAREQLVRTPAGCTPLLLFMSDGEGDTGVPQMEGILADHGARGLQVHVLAYGSANATMLQAHATAGRGTFHAAPSPEDLVRTFQQIAQNAQGADGLVQEFARRVGDAVADRVIADHM
jgi:uncharacterized protein YegL